MRTLGIIIFFLLLITGCDKGVDKAGREDPAMNRRSGAGKDSSFFLTPPVKTIAESHKPETHRFRKHKEQPVLVTKKITEFRMVDTARIRKIEDLRRLNEEIDLSEPVSREYLNGDVENRGERSFTLISREKFLKINFDNDLLDNTDHFFTNGIRIELISPGLRYFPLHFLMVPYWRPAINYYGMALTQNMYTPSTTKTGGILYGDRPYAAYLCLGTYKISNDPVKRFRQTTELDIGVIGPLSGGEKVQTTFHNAVPTNNEPLGWEYQIQNDLVLNYSLTYEKGLVSLPAFDLNLNGIGNLGTLNTSVSGGISLRAGLMNPYFSRLSVTDRNVNHFINSKNVQVYFFLKGNGTVIGYDATLQGGLFNHSSVYVIPSGDVTRVMFNGSTGLTFSFGGIRIDLEQYLISPEFRRGWWHKWVHIGLTFSI